MSNVTDDPGKNALVLPSDYEKTDDGLEEEEELSPLVVGYAWVARITTYSVEFAILVWFGWYLDKTYSLRPWGILVGAAMGLVAFISGLFTTAKRLENEEVREKLRNLKKK